MTKNVTWASGSRMIIPARPGLAVAVPAPAPDYRKPFETRETGFGIFALVSFSAILMGLALPNEIFLYGLWPLGFVALAPLYEAFRRSTDRRMALAAGALFGALQQVFTSYWLFFYKDLALWTIGASSLGYALVYMLPALYLHFAARQGGRFAPLLFSLLWAVFEFGKSTGFLGYPWGLLPYSLTAAPQFLQITDITGVYGLSFILALSACVIASWMVPPAPALRRWGLPSSSQKPALHQRAIDERLSWTIFAAACIFLVLGYGILRLTLMPAPDSTFKALLVQQNVDPWLEGESTVLESNIALTRRALIQARAGSVDGQPDLIVFSETSLRRSFPENQLYYETQPPADPLLPLLRESGAWLLTGAPHVLDWKDFQVMNAALLIDAKGELVDVYGKTHPVPFTEAIPFMEYAWFRAFMKNVVGLTGGWTPGGRMTLFSMPLRAGLPGASSGPLPGASSEPLPGTSSGALPSGASASDSSRSTAEKPESAQTAALSGGHIRFGVPICFEDAFAGLCGRFVRDGADILINITNDSWSRTVSAELQHWAAARFRAIETRRPLLRSTNGGLTCLVGIDGRNVATLPLFTPASLSLDVPLYRDAGLTIYTRFGDWFVALCALLSASIIVVRMREFTKTRRIP